MNQFSQTCLAEQGTLGSRVTRCGSRPTRAKTDRGSSPNRSRRLRNAGTKPGSRAGRRSRRPSTICARARCNEPPPGNPYMPRRRMLSTSCWHRLLRPCSASSRLAPQRPNHRGKAADQRGHAEQKRIVESDYRRDSFAPFLTKSVTCREAKSLSPVLARRRCRALDDRSGLLRKGWTPPRWGPMPSGYCAAAAVVAALNFIAVPLALVLPQLNADM